MADKRHIAFHDMCQDDEEREMPTQGYDAVR